MGTIGLEINVRPPDRNNADRIFIFNIFQNIMVEIKNIIIAKKIIPYINNMSLIKTPIFSLYEKELAKSKSSQQSEQ